MKQYFLLVLVGTIVLCGTWLGYRHFIGAPLRISLGQHEYTLEVVRTDEERRLGLGNRDMLCGHCAMLFLFDQPGQYAFWMKDMRFPIDIAWLSGNRIVWIERNVSSESTMTYQPDVVADQVLELNSGALG